MPNVDVYYIGRKEARTDTVTNSKIGAARVWRGFGSKLSVPEEDAQILLSEQYSAVWGDEAAMKAAKKDHDREEAERKDREKRIAERAAAEREEQEKAAKDARARQRGNETEAQDDGQGEDRETIIRQAILALDPTNTESDYTKTFPPRPRVNRIQELTGFSVSADEVSEALQELVKSGQVTLPEKDA